LVATVLAVPTAARAAGFYTHPRGLAGYAVGDAIRSAPARKVDPAVRRVGRQRLIMYRSESATGAPRAMTGVLITPKGRPPRGGWPLIAWDHGTTGVTANCAPSKMPDLAAYARFVATFVAAGYVVVAPDYEGLGLPGELHNYADIPSEARSTIDAVTAAHQFVRPLRRGWVVAGHSQGGQASLGTSEFASTRVPFLPLLGTVALAPATHLDEALDILGAQQPASALTAPEAAFLMISVKVNDPAFDAASILTPQFAAGIRAAQQRGLCYVQLADWYARHPVPRLFKRDWRTSWPLKQFASRNSPGNQLGAGPVFLGQGLADRTIPPPLTAQMGVKLCQLGTPVDSRTYPGVNHIGLPHAADRDVLAWVRDRFGGKPAPSNCPPPQPPAAQG
jgi:dienelactone hydrolase